MHKPFIFLAAVLVTTLIGRGSAPARSCDSGNTETDDNRQFITQAFEQWADGRGSFFQDVLAPDMVWTIEGSGPSAGRYDGRQAFIDQAVRPFITRLSTPVRPVSWQVWADGKHVIVRWFGEGMARDGTPYRNNYVWILRLQNGKAIEVTAFLDLLPYDDVLRRIPAVIEKKPEEIENEKPQQEAVMQQHIYIGMWITADGNIRHELLPNGRYDEARGSHKSVYQGRYEIKANNIYYWDDTGFTADATFVSSDELHHAGMVLYRQQ